MSHFSQGLALGIGLFVLPGLLGLLLERIDELRRARVQQLRMSVA